MKKLFVICYLLFVICFVAFSYLFIDPGLFYLRFLFTNFFQLHRVLTTIGFILFIGIGFMFYVLCLYNIKRNRLSLRELLTIILATTVILLFAYPAMLSFDIFNYIATAKVTYFYHENPYILMPINFTHDPLLLFMHAANKAALYAPFWLFISGIPYLLGFGSFLLILFNFKIFIVLFYVATVFLVWKMTNNKMQTAFFALNPLVLIESLVSSHNDIVMMFLLLASVYFLLQKKRGWGIAVYILSLLIKYATAILILVYIVAFFKKVSREKLFLWIALFMYGIFFLSSLREEIYPWYSLWFLLPVTFLIGDNLLTWVSVTFSFSMLLRYIPFMLLGTYFGPTPVLKIILMLTPVAISVIVYLLTHKQKRFV